MPAKKEEEVKEEKVLTEQEKAIIEKQKEL